MEPSGGSDRLAVDGAAAVGAVAGATVSTVRSSMAPAADVRLLARVDRAQLVIREALPPLIATAGVVSVWAARHLAKHESLQLNVALSWGWLPFLLRGPSSSGWSQRGLK